MIKTSKIYVAGHRGLVGSAIFNNLKSKGFLNIITRTHQELDLTDQRAVASFFEEEKPDYVFLAAAKVGGIIANNTYRADFIYENLMIQNNVIHQSYVHDVDKLMFLGSTCIYPKSCPQPMKEEYLLTDILEYTNEPYAIAKIAGIKLCESYNLQYGTNFISVMPTNLYGYDDNFDLEKSHVLPALIRKMYLGHMLESGNEAPILKDLQVTTMEQALEILSRNGVYKDKVEIWGSGNPMREFLWSEDMADACVYLMENIDFSEMTEGEKEVRNTHINIGTGIDISIKALAEKVKQAVGFRGRLYFNRDMPDGTLRKLTDCSKLHALGWKHKVSLDEGIELLYNWYLEKPLIP